MLKAASKDSAEMDVSDEQGESDKATNKDKTGRVYDIDGERSTARIAAGQSFGKFAAELVGLLREAEACLEEEVDAYAKAKLSDLHDILDRRTRALRLIVGNMDYAQLNKLDEDEFKALDLQGSAAFRLEVEAWKASGDSLPFAEFERPGPLSGLIGKAKSFGNWHDYWRQP